MAKHGDVWVSPCGRMESWLPVAGFAGYEVSDAGRVRSWRIDGPSDKLRRVPRILRGWLQQGYPFVHLSCGRRAVKKAVHRLVAEAFLGPRPIEMQASHLDGNRAHCCAHNLVWETAKQNNNRKRDHGTWQSNERHGSTRASDNDVEFIRRYCAAIGHGAQRQCARVFGLSETHVSSIVRRRARV